MLAAVTMISMYLTFGYILFLYFTRHRRCQRALWRTLFFVLLGVSVLLFILWGLSRNIHPPFWAARLGEGR